MTPENRKEKHHKNKRPIQKLPELLINQIAAGEVVERPASIVKELIENSLDAGATRIEISLKSGGMEEIKISDNGWGIDASEITLAFERHATSKISTQEDLEGIHTFGFRGEALSSIASVSNITIITRQLTCDFATHLTLSSGEVSTPPQKKSGSVGTTITVSALFSRVPARQKFLRTPATELSHCIRTLKEIALGNPECIFSLSHHDRTLVQFTQRSYLERFKEVLRPVWEPDYFSESTQGMHYEMFLSPFSQNATKGELFLFINQRCIRNRVLLQAIKQAYQESFGIGCEPSGAVYLTLRSDWVDPNVHPQKHEVRFLKQEAIFQWLLSSLRKKLSPMKPHLVEPATFPENSEFLSASPFQALSPQLQFKATLKEKWLLFEDELGLLITNETILTELALQKILAETQPNTQSLKIPLLITLNNTQKENFLGNKVLLQSFGFELEYFGETELVVKAIPSYLAEEEVEAVILKTLAGHFPTKDLIKLIANHKTSIPLPTNIHSQSQTTDGKLLFFRVLFDDLMRYF